LSYLANRQTDKQTNSGSWRKHNLLGGGNYMAQFERLQTLAAHMELRCSFMKLFHAWHAAIGRGDNVGRPTTFWGAPSLKIWQGEKRLTCDMIYDNTSSDFKREYFWNG